MNISELLRIDRSIEIQAAPARVWRALTDINELSVWFRVRIEGDMNVGSELWMTSTQPEYAGQRWPVRIVELTPTRRVVWQWHPGEVTPDIDRAEAPRTTVTFTLEPVGAGTRLHLSETGFEAVEAARRAKAYADNSHGWTEVLEWLQQYVEAR